MTENLSMPPLRSLVLSEVRLPLTAAQLKTRTMPASSNVVQKKMGTTQQEEVQERNGSFCDWKFELFQTWATRGGKGKFTHLLE